MTSFTFSLSILSGEPKGEGPLLPAPRFITRGDPHGLLGERGGALPAGNIDGAELTDAAFPDIPETLRDIPALASSIKERTCINIYERIVQVKTPSKEISLIDIGKI